jgi:hypothetical protein
MLPIPTPSVFTQKLLHTGGKVDVTHLQKQMSVVRHQAVTNHRPPVLPSDATEKLEMNLAIVIVVKDLASVVASGGDMIDTACLDLAIRPGHSLDDTTRRRARKGASPSCLSLLRVPTRV